MAEFSELVKNFNKVRDYMRDFYIYGFKSRGDFGKKSPRTYDNEKRRCESYLGPYMKWTYTSGNKVSFVSVDCGKIAANPLYSAWKSKSFTVNDIMLHFYIIGGLRRRAMAVEELTSMICERSGVIFDAQTVRLKCNEYFDYGILSRAKNGKAFAYSLAENIFPITENVLDAVRYFQGGTLGVIGSYILDNAAVENDLFLFKHNYIAHTLDDAVLLDILAAIHQKRYVRLERVIAKTGTKITNTVCPVKILASSQSGRRYLCAYTIKTNRFTSYRLDSIKSVRALEPYNADEDLDKMLARNLCKLWGVSFDGGSRNESFSLTLQIDEEKESHIMHRLEKEGRGGSVTRVSANTFLFEKEVFDANEALPWVKTFIGRIISYSATPPLEAKLKADIMKMAELYELENVQ